MGTSARTPVSADFTAHIPKSMLSENFRVASEIFKTIPEKEKYVFAGSVSGLIDKEMPNKPGIKTSRHRFTHKILKQKPISTNVS